MTDTPELSVVIPCFNEEDNVRAICAAVTQEAERHALSYEIVLIDNCSTDATRTIIESLCAEDRRIRAIFNNRNYGQMRSPTHGIYQARGSAVIGMCADFQDPPALIGQFLRLWRGGVPIVLGQRRSEPAGALLSAARRAGYGLLTRVADHPVLPNVTGFGLYDRVVVDTLARWNEPEPFFRGMLVESGYPIALVPFDRPARAAGETKNGPAALLGFALSGLAASARSLLRLPILLAAWAMLAALCLCLAGGVAALLGHAAWPWLATGYGTALFAIVLLFLGLMGDQIRLIAERQRGIPLVIEDRRINFDADEPA